MGLRMAAPMNEYSAALCIWSATSVPQKQKNLQGRRANPVSGFANATDPSAREQRRCHNARYASGRLSHVRAGLLKAKPQRRSATRRESAPARGGLEADDEVDDKRPDGHLAEELWQVVEGARDGERPACMRQCSGMRTLCSSFEGRWMHCQSQLRISAGVQNNDTVR